MKKNSKEIIIKYNNEELKPKIVIDGKEYEVNSMENKMTEKEIEKIKKGELLFKNHDNEYYKYNNKYYSISVNHDDDGDCWCQELEIDDMKQAISDELINLDDEANYAINSIRLNSLFIKEVYDSKIKLLMIKF